MNELRADSSHHEGREDKGCKTISFVATVITRGGFRHICNSAIMGVFFICHLASEPRTQKSGIESDTFSTIVATLAHGTINVQVVTLDSCVMGRQHR